MSIQYTDIQLSILLLLYNREDSITRYALAKELSASRQTIGYSINRLIDMGIVEESESGVQLKDFFYHPKVKALFQEIITMISDYIDAEEIISEGESHDMIAITECIFMIIMTLSKQNRT